MSNEVELAPGRITSRLIGAASCHGGSTASTAAGPTAVGVTLFGTTLLVDARVAAAGAESPARRWGDRSGCEPSARTRREKVAVVGTANDGRCATVLADRIREARAALRTGRSSTNPL